MRRFLFISNLYAYVLFFFWAYTVLKLEFSLKFLVTIIVFSLFYFFRKSSIPYRETLKTDGEIYLSPVHGIVESIRRDTTSAGDGTINHEVRISIGMWKEKGLYLPTAGEVSYLKAHQGLKIPRKSDSQFFYRPIEELAHTDLTLTSKNNLKTLMRFIDCKYGLRPSIWLKSGDRGKGAAGFGYYPFGGTLLIYLPQNSEILVFEKEHIVPGQTVIASIKEM